MRQIIIYIMYETDFNNGNIDVADICGFRTE